MPSYTLIIWIKYDGIKISTPLYMKWYYWCQNRWIFISLLVFERERKKVDSLLQVTDLWFSCMSKVYKVANDFSLLVKERGRGYRLEKIDQKNEQLQSLARGIKIAHYWPHVEPKCGTLMFNSLDGYIFLCSKLKNLQNCSRVSQREERRGRNAKSFS